MEFENHQNSFQGKSTVRCSVCVEIARVGKSVQGREGKAIRPTGEQNAKAEGWTNMSLWASSATWW